MRIPQGFLLALYHLGPSVLGKCHLVIARTIAYRKLAVTLNLLTLIGLGAFSINAQVNSPATVRGQVVDQNGLAIKAARVEIRNETDKGKVKHTDDEGRFTFTGVAAGHYHIAVEAAGFANHQDEIIVAIATHDPIKIVLSLANLKEATEVRGESKGLSVEAGANANVIVLRGPILKSLPRNEQQLRQLLERMAGSLAARLDISVNGLAGASLPPIATIKEIRINSNPFSAAYHEPGSARVEIETKSGDDLMRGSVYLNYRHSALDARNAFSLVKPPLEYRDLGGWWSSRLFNSRSFIFGFFERQRHEQAVPVTAYLPDGQFNANVPTPAKSTMGNLRADFVPSDSHKVSLSFDSSYSWQRGPEFTSFDLPERSYDTRPSEQGLQVSWHATLSSNLINEVQLRLARTRSESVSENVAAAVEVAGAFSGGGPQCCPERRAGERLRLADNLTVSFGRHLLKAGLSLAGTHNSELSERDFGGTFYYASLSFYRLQRPTLYTINIGMPRLGFGLWQGGVYLQDEIRLTPSFTLAPGLRYEAQTHLNDRNNLAPRLGFAWSPFKRQHTVIRGGGGLFYQQLEEEQLSSALRFDGVRQRQIIILRPRLSDPFGGRPVTSFPVSINRISPDLRTPYQWHTALSVERRLPHDLIVTATYNYLRGVHLFRTRDVNASLPGEFTRPNPGFGRIAQLESSASSKYHGLAFGFSQSLGARASLFGNYTLAHAMDDADGPEAMPVESYNLVLERGFSVRDVRHQFFTGLWLALPWGVEVSPLIYFNTGRPYNIITGFDDNGDSVVNDRPAGIRRNAGRGPNFASVDLRLGKTFSFKRPGVDQQLFGVELGAEATNLFNRVNLAGFNGVQTSPFFGRANAALNARQILLQLTFYFH